MNDILKILDENLAKEIEKLCILDKITEIRIREGKNVIVYEEDNEIEINFLVTNEIIYEIIRNVSKNSIYAIEESIKQGFVTTEGGHRIGICGEVKVENDNILSMCNISSLNIRVAKQVIGVSNKIMKYVLKNGVINNTLIVAMPGRGKTTMLRDIARNISNGINDFNFKGANVGLIDERGEIASEHMRNNFTRCWYKNRCYHWGK